jgi:hypothetical protein
MPVPQETLGNYSYTTQPVDIGTGYASGITAAGKSIAQGISGILGGIDDKGNVTHGVLEQNQTANDMLTALNQMKGPDGNPVLPADAYNAAMGKSLGAKQQLIGMYQGQWQTNMAALAEQAKAIAVAKATAAAQAPYRIQEIQETGRQQQATAQAGREATGGRPVVIKPGPPANPPANPPEPNNSLKTSLYQNQPGTLNRPFGLNTGY